ncbi:hypothetical protein [Sphingobacterium hungaricum]|uniref:Uncharacterized protein n=1 Tax=Sphingobacterium hungaricum TaxID=2082723 RepID=A0A928YRK4_9SPHI|nr:hypothetical protein [Sphingobacterium hungaricum]MBE8714747.1 hypothetical protein [Sphingobacterium hungaricum]
MTLQDFKNTLGDSAPKPELSILLQSLWFDANNDWRTAHDLVDSLGGKDAAHVHAYLHRVEGDLFNARYWYGQAQEPVCTSDLSEEWESLVNKFIK